MHAIGQFKNPTADQGLAYLVSLQQSPRHWPVQKPNSKSVSAYFAALRQSPRHWPVKIRTATHMVAIQQSFGPHPVIGRFKTPTANQRALTWCRSNKASAPVTSLASSCDVTRPSMALIHCDRSRKSLRKRCRSYESRSFSLRASAWGVGNRSGR